MHEVRKIGERAHQRKWEPISGWFGDTNLILYVVGQMRQRIPLLQSTLRGNLFVTTGERHWLERKERNLLWIVERETNDGSNLIVVDSIHERSNQNNFDAGFVKIINRSHLHIEQVSNLAMTVRIVSDSVELQVNVTQSCLGRLSAELFALRKFDPVSCRLNTVVTNLAGVFDCFDEMRRD